MNPLKVVAFLDGSAGHEKQTKGVLQAIEELTPLHVEYIRIPAPCFRSVISDWFKYLAVYGLKIKMSYNRMFPTAPLDLIIGTGSHTHVPMLILKEQCGGRIITCMTPDSLLIKKIDLCFIPQHDNQRSSDNILFTVGPPNSIPYSEDKKKEKGLILVGGINKKGFNWRTEEIILDISSILQRDSSINWTISSSLRTPTDMNKALDVLVAEYPDVVFYRPRDTPPGWIEEQYADNYFVWVTSDSMSMIYEALTAGCRVGILPVQWKKKDSKYEKSVQYLLKNGMVISYEQWKNGETDPIVYGRLDEANRCAKEILLRWWPDRLR